MNKWKLMMMVCLSSGTLACAPEDRPWKCLDNAECGPGEACIDGECILLECTQDGDCQLGAICVEGTCQLGCQNDRDCAEGWTCENDQCVKKEQTDCCGGCQASFYCDQLSCECVFSCSTDADCPAGTHCDTDSGACVKDQVECQTNADCPEGWICNQSTYTCESPGSLNEGDACFSDDECDQAQGLLCDSQVTCYGCMLADPDFNPTFTCRYECVLTIGDCPVEDRVCKYRHMGFVGLCIPYED